MIFRKIFFLLFFTVYVLSAFAQGKFGGGHDQKDFSFGYTISVYNTESILYRKDGWQDPFYDALRNEFATGYLKSISSENQFGVGASMLMFSKIVDELLVGVFNPGFIFAKYSVLFNYLDENEGRRRKDLKFVGFTLPFGVRLRSQRYNNVRLYFMSGLNYNINLVSNTAKDDSELIPTKRALKYKLSFLAYEVGLGTEIYFEYFKMMPEIKLSYSMTNALKHEKTPFSQPLLQVIPKSITISVFFQ